MGDYARVMAPRSHLQTLLARCWGASVRESLIRPDGMPSSPRVRVGPMPHRNRNLWFRQDFFEGCAVGVWPQAPTRSDLFFTIFKCCAARFRSGYSRAPSEWEWAPRITGRRSLALAAL